MNAFYKLKKFEIIVNIIAPLIAVFTYSLDKKIGTNFDKLTAYIISLITIGSLHIISVIIHFFLPKDWQAIRIRKWYSLITLVFIIIGALFIFLEVRDFGLRFLMVASLVTPLLALTYIYIIIREFDLLRKTLNN